jgi:hypothetical protein
VRPQRGGFQGEVDHLKNWLAQRADWIDSQFIESPRFVNVDPDDCPCAVDEGFAVELEASSGEIYYTLDGTDPRATGGAVAESAVLYEAPIPVTQNIKVTARLLTEEGAWSQTVAATFVRTIPELAITELMYNPPEATPEEDPDDEFNGDSPLEFIELWNYGAEPMDLSDVRFSRGVTFSFDGPDALITSLERNQVAVLVNDLEAFSRRYTDPDILVAGEYGGSLSDTSETIILLGELEVPVASFRYDDDWYPETDGGGYSLVPVDPTAPGTLDAAAGWRASSEMLGSPGFWGGAPGSQLPGDFTQDSRLAIDDAAGLLLHLFRGGGAQLPCGDGSLGDPANVELLDADGDGAVELTDAVYLLSFLFQEGNPPANGTECVPIAGCPPVCQGRPLAE